MDLFRSKTVFYLNDELGSYIGKDLRGNSKLIPLIKFSNFKHGENQYCPSSFSILIITADIQAGTELVEAIVPDESHLADPSNILKNNIIFGEYAIHRQIDQLEAVTKRHRDFMLKLQEAKADRLKENVIQKITDIQKTHGINLFTYLTFSVIYIQMVTCLQIIYLYYITRVLLLIQKPK